MFIPHVHTCIVPGLTKTVAALRGGNRGSLALFKFKKQHEMCLVFCDKDTYVCIVCFNNIFLLKNSNQLQMDEPVILKKIIKVFRILMNCGWS